MHLQGLALADLAMRADDGDARAVGAEAAAGLRA